jgi:hypothetical protein
VAALAALLDIPMLAPPMAMAVPSEPAASAAAAQQQPLASPASYAAATPAPASRASTPAGQPELADAGSRRLTAESFATEETQVGPLSRRLTGESSGDKLEPESLSRRLTAVSSASEPLLPASLQGGSPSAVRELEEAMLTDGEGEEGAAVVPESELLRGVPFDQVGLCSWVIRLPRTRGGVNSKE